MWVPCPTVSTQQRAAAAHTKAYSRKRGDSSKTKNLDSAAAISNGGALEGTPVDDAPTRVDIPRPSGRPCWSIPRTRAEVDGWRVEDRPAEARSPSLVEGATSTSSPLLAGEAEEAFARPSSRVAVLSPPPRPPSPPPYCSFPSSAPCRLPDLLAKEMGLPSPVLRPQRRHGAVNFQLYTTMVCI